ncbi:MAG: hypothetical protein QOC93_2987 [Actinomycetota bacterium]|nr:hypothetical protein [Actinomycetota bacterium]
MVRDVATARQSQLVTTYGVGALFPSAEQSFMICGADEWDDRRARVIEEPRLARSLGVFSFRSPPAGGRRGDVPVVRFPLVHYCPGCRRIGYPQTFNTTTERMRCDRDERELTPSRFVACCEDGHIQDFPYFSWLHRISGAALGDAGDANHVLSITTRGRSSSLGDIVISCTCGVQPVSMAGAFSRSALVEVSGCRGRRPWLESGEDQDCSKPLRTLQRGSSNVWFPIIRSTISIPPWTGGAARFVEKHWAVLKGIDGAELEKAVRAAVVSDAHVSEDSVLSLVQRRKGIEAGQPPTDAELRQEEYDALCDSNRPSPEGYDDFVSIERDIASDVSDVVAQVMEVSRLREVRALDGFTRVVPPAGANDPRKAALSARALSWLPAVEVLGEGVFVRFHPDVVAEWERSNLAQSRARLMTRAQERRDRATERPASPPVAPRLVALHTVAHLLLKELSLDAGYPIASLRERVYADGGQCGVLVYTASSDAAGSLGGLAALAGERRLGSALTRAIRRATWCSSDPVCAESGVSGLDGLNLAACHACTLLPEPSCEHQNQFLDRVSVVGTLGNPDVGMLGELLDSERFASEAG